MLASSGREMAPAVSGRRVSRSDVDAVGRDKIFLATKARGGAGRFALGNDRRHASR